MKRSIARAKQLLDLDVTPVWQRLHDKRCRTLLEGFKRYLAKHPLSLHKQSDETYFAQVLVDYLRHAIESALNERAQLSAGKRQFDSRLSRATSPTERRALLLDYATELGASARQLRADRRALNRWLGADALNDRWQTRLANNEQKIDFAMQRLGAITAHILENTAPDQQLSAWQRLRYDDLCERLFDDSSTDERITLATLQALALSTAAMPSITADEKVSSACQQYIYRLALDPEEPVWLQRQALQHMPQLVPDAFVATLTYRFSQPSEGDDAFVRAGAVEVWSRYLHEYPDLTALATRIADDNSALVRQRLARVLTEVHTTSAEIVPELLHKLCADEEPSVRGQALLSIETLLQPHTEMPSWLLQPLQQALLGEHEEFTYRVALRVWTTIAHAHAHTSEQQDYAALLEIVGERHRTDPSLRSRRWSAQARELYLCAKPTHKAVMQSVRKQLESGARELDLTSLPPDASRTIVMRVLAALAQTEFGFEADFTAPRKLRLKPSFNFGFRWWRCWYEWRHPSTDKRQGFKHTIGRTFTTTLRAPSAILAEVSQTKVPGEPLIITEEDGWRPYLPLVDECLAALQQDRDIEVHRIYTSEGVTEIEPPRTVRGQLWAWWQITKRFEHFAAWRNWQPQDPNAASHYVEQLSALGFSIRFTPHPCPATQREEGDPSVARFFAGLMPLPIVGDVWLEFKQHAASAYENTVFELAAYVAIIAAFFFGRHLLLAKLMRRARNKIPLVIGGWGTRGKSGTERLKAAMFNAMGLSVFSKTTGCEAMFVMNRPYRRLRELFLFRPYDKATIWEQFNMVRLASRLDTDVFLWECMGLTPSYVRVLQRDWMRDDISTITNTFPDHEDLQGPAGVNIPEVMCEFINPQGCLVTSEEKMLPILKRDALAKDTELHAVGWLQAGLLTPDVLDRFPYEEHPHNIALVLAVADQLDIEHDFALKEMADRVVMDLGVLKSYPLAQVGDAHMEFIMGMSANERFGALNNWSRMGMADATLSNSPKTWTSTLVNNRADRVPRSRVFADLLVRDINADQHVLIGTNLSGLRGYIEESWRNHMQGFSLWPADDNEANPRRELRNSATALRIPVTLDELRGRLQALVPEPEQLDTATSLDELWTAFSSLSLSDHALIWGEKFKEQQLAFVAINAEVEHITGRDDSKYPDFESRLLQQLWSWFEAKLVFVADPHIGGEALVTHIAQHAPPRMHNRIMGMQNIKGTGLSFVYTWQSWEEQAALAEQLSNEDDAVFAEALNRLANQPHIGVLAHHTLGQAFQQALHHPAAQRESAQAQLTDLIDRVQVSTLSANVEPAKDSANRWPGLAKIITALEAFFDAGDAVRRRRIADRVYQDLVTSSISEDRAIAEIKAINQRQKGGWLRQKFGI